MKFLENYYSKKFKYDLVNKFQYPQIKNLPQLNKIVITFGCKSNDIKLISASLLALELITNQKGSLTRTKHPNLLLKIRKGDPIGCKVTLRKSVMFDFIAKIMIEIMPRLSFFSSFSLEQSGTFSFVIKDLFVFSELKSQYYIFNSLFEMNITFVCDTKKKKELLYILRVFKLPVFF